MMFTKRVLCKLDLGKVYRRYFSSHLELQNVLMHQLDDIKAAGTWKPERIITSKQDVNITVKGNDDRRILNFCANNYLGLSSHPDVIAAGQAALASHGAGLSSVRFICGTQDLHKELESKLAEFHGKESAIVYASCFDANAGLFECLLTEDDVVLSDTLNHASIIDGIRLCKAKRVRYQHKDMMDLERQLRAHPTSRLKLIATDGVFSMDGDVAPLSDICTLAETYNAIVFIDDCHATGFFGNTGRGTEQFCGVDGRVHIINSTLGKALGGAAGGYTCGPESLIELLRQKSRPYLFSNSLPPATVAQAIQVLDMLMPGSPLINKVEENTRTFRHAMTNAGFTLSGHERHPICPIMLGDAQLAAHFAQLMLEEDIYVIGFSYPVVPKGAARIRVQISASHSTTDIDHTVRAFTDIGRRLGVIT